MDDRGAVEADGQRRAGGEHAGPDRVREHLSVGLLAQRNLVLLDELLVLTGKRESVASERLPEGCQLRKRDVARLATGPVPPRERRDGMSRGRQTDDGADDQQRDAER